VKKHYLIKIVPPWGYRVFRLRFTPPQIVVAAVLTALVLAGSAGFYAWEMRHAEARVGELRDLTATQRQQLEKIDAEAADLDGKLRALERQNDEIRGLMGVGANKHAPAKKAAAPAPPTDDSRQSSRDDVRFSAVSARIDALRERSARLRGDSERLQQVALRVLNMHRLEDLARARVLAAIPSLNPVSSGVAGIASPFGWRFSPWPEFHQGVDLEADYEPVRAAAAGTVVSAGYDGGYGIKVDIDHGNGYHTWYCHLSRADVEPGTYVRKAQHIALSGSTGASTGPHLHYQIMLDGKPTDPAPYLNGVPPKVLASLK
jgi:murein DD-endopeptidase MepM/ murein hydrolase activator NlpD